MKKVTIIGYTADNKNVGQRVIQVPADADYFQLKSNMDYMAAAESLMNPDGDNAAYVSVKNFEGMSGPTVSDKEEFGIDA